MRFPTRPPCHPNHPKTANPPCHPLPPRCRFLPLLPPRTRNIKSHIPANPLQFSPHLHPAHESCSKSGKNGNVHHPSQHYRAPFPSISAPLVSFHPLCLLLIPPCPSVSSVSSVFVLISPPPRFGCGPLPRGVQYSGLRQTPVEHAVAAQPSPSHVQHRGRPRPAAAQRGASRRVSAPRRL